MLFWISLVLFVGTLLGLLAVIGVWVYSDAKIRSDKPFTWLLIALLTPSLFGVLIYLLVGRTKHSTNKSRFKLPLILMVISFVAATGLFITTIAASGNLPILPGVSIGKLNNNLGNQWSLSFKTSGEKHTKTVHLTQEELKRVQVEGHSETGSVYLLILQGARAKVVDISNFSKNSIDLTEYEAGTVELVLYNENARDVSVNITWDN